MFTIYSHKTDQEPVNNVVFANTPVDENIDAWVCPSVDPDFIEIKDAVNEYGGAFFSPWTTRWWCSFPTPFVLQARPGRAKRVKTRTVV